MARSGGVTGPATRSKRCRASLLGAGLLQAALAGAVLGAVLLAAAPARAMVPEALVETPARLDPQALPRAGGSRSLLDFRVVSRIHSQVNQSTRYTSDDALYGQREFWTVGRDAGDCEDYALAKRALLLEAGADPSHLRLMSLWIDSGEYHLVLVVRTDRGEYVLDARHARPMTRQELETLGYRWHLIEEGGRWFAVH